MPRFVSVTPAFVEKIKQASGGNPSLEAAVLGALGVPYGAAMDATDYPVLGWHMTSSSEEFLLYALTPGRFVRYQVVADQRSLTVAVPLHRVTRVVEQTGKDLVSLIVELDADATVSTDEWLQETNAEGRTLGRGVSRSTRTQYVLEAGTPAQAAELVAFAIALRNALGS